jgi:hypothetical protein
MSYSHSLQQGLHGSTGKTILSLAIQVLLKMMRCVSLDIGSLFPGFQGSQTSSLARGTYVSIGTYGELALHYQMSSILIQIQRPSEGNLRSYHSAD